MSDTAAIGGRLMRHTIVIYAVICALLMFLPPGAALGQEFVEFTSVEDGFRIAFPGRPQVQNTTYTSQYGYPLPAKVYSVTSGPQRFSVTVVDFRGIQQQAIAKTCPKGPDTCQRRALTAVIGEGEWRNDVRGAMLYALNTFINRGAKITNITGDWQDLVEGMMVQLTNADQSRTFASISMHDNRLYIVEGTAPVRGYPPPIAFQQNFAVVDSQGTSIRYQRMYSNAYHGLGEYPVPSRAGQP
jgi:hypothetical protein